MSQEIELKLALPARALATLRRHPLLQAAQKVGKTTTLDNTYYDTAELTLKARKVAIRTRRQGRQWLQTVKCAAVSTGGLTSRPEWEGPYAGHFDFSAVNVPEVARLLHKHHDHLVPVFTTRFRRETRLYAPRDGVRILLMTDTGTIDAGERQAPICELELELVEGSALDLLDLACTLARDLPLTPSDVSKAERGYRLFLGQRETPATTVSSPLAAGQGVIEGFREQAFACLRQWQANAAALAAGNDDPEFIHQLRVALRRLRALLRIFAPALPAGFHDEWNARLRDCAATVAEARDLDVLHETLLAPVIGDELVSEDISLSGLLAISEDARRSAREEALRKLNDAGQGLAMLEFTAALHRLPATAPQPSLHDFACARLDHLRKKARRRFEAAAGLAPTRLHALRIALKHLRYGTEFFAPFMSNKAGKHYLASLAKAQNTLGYLNDVDVGRARLSGWADDLRPLQAAAAFVTGWHAPRYARYRRRILDELRPLLWGKKPWH